MLKFYTEKIPQNQKKELDLIIQDLINSFTEQIKDFVSEIDFQYYCLNQLQKEYQNHLAGITIKSYSSSQDPKNIHPFIKIGSCNNIYFIKTLTYQFGPDKYQDINIYLKGSHDENNLKSEEINERYQIIKTIFNLKPAIDEIQHICALHHKEIDYIGARKESTLKDFLYCRGKYFTDNPFAIIRLGWSDLGKSNLEHGHILQDLLMEILMAKPNSAIHQYSEMIRLGADCLLIIRGNDSMEISNNAVRIAAELRNLSFLLASFSDRQEYEHVIATYLAKNSDPDLTNTILTKIKQTPLLKEFIEKNNITDLLKTLPILIESFPGETETKDFKFLGLAKLINQINPAFEEYKEYVKKGLILADYSLKLNTDLLNIIKDAQGLLNYNYHTNTLEIYGNLSDSLYTRLENYANKSFVNELKEKVQNLIININKDHVPGTNNSFLNLWQEYSIHNEKYFSFDNIYFFAKNNVHKIFLNIINKFYEIENDQIFNFWKKLLQNPEIQPYVEYLYGDKNIEDYPSEEKDTILFIDRYLSQLYRMKDAKGTTPYFSKGTHELFNDLIINLETDSNLKNIIFENSNSENDIKLMEIAKKYGEKYQLNPDIVRIRLDILIHRFKKDGCLFFRTGGDEFRIIAKEENNTLGIVDCDFNKLSGYMLIRAIVGDIAVSLISKRIQDLFIYNLKNKNAGKSLHIFVPKIVETINKALLDLNRGNLDQGEKNPNYLPLYIPLSYFGDLKERIKDKHGLNIKYIKIKLPNSEHSRIYAILEKDLGSNLYTKNILNNFKADLINIGWSKQQIDDLNIESYLNAPSVIENNFITKEWLLDLSEQDLSNGLVDIIKLHRVNVKGLSNNKDDHNESFPIVHHMSLSMGYVSYLWKNYYENLYKSVFLSELAKKYNDLSILGNNRIKYYETTGKNNQIYSIAEFYDDQNKIHRLIVLNKEIKPNKKQRKVGRQNDATVLELDPVKAAEIGIDNLDGLIIFVQ